MAKYCESAGVQEVGIEACADLTVWWGVGIVFVVAPSGCKLLGLFVVLGL